MNYYGFPPGYNPHHPRNADPAPTIPANVIARAKLAGASHVSSDGTAAYVKRFEVWYRAEWQGVEFGCWWGCDEPGEMVRL